MRDFYIICYLFDRLWYFVQANIVTIFACALLVIGCYLFIRLEYAAMQNESVEVNGLDMFRIRSIYDLLSVYQLNNGTLFGHNRAELYAFAPLEDVDEDTDEDECDA